MRVLITLGTTREYIDNVRYISNSSSGKMGISLIKEAVSRGHEVTAVSGPVNLEIPVEAKIHSVVTAEEMIDTTLSELSNSHDVFISTAAIADYSPEKKEGKIKSDKKELILKLKQNPKLTKLVKEKHPSIFGVGFKAEHGLPENELINTARKKLLDDNLDMVVANDVKKNSFGSDSTDAHVVRKDKVDYLETDSKQKISKKLWDMIEKQLANKH